MDAAAIISLLQIYGYPIMFILMYLEGPIATFVSSFLASFGIFNLAIVWGLSFLGDFISDLVHFYIGHKGHSYIVKKLEKEGVAYRLIAKLQKLMHQNLFRSLFLVKISPPPISSAGLFLAGTLKGKQPKAILYSAIISLIIESIFIMLGFFSGTYFNSILKYFNNVLLIVAFSAIVILLFLLKQHISKIIFENKSNKK